MYNYIELFSGEEGVNPLQPSMLSFQEKSKLHTFKRQHHRHLIVEVELSCSFIAIYLYVCIYLFVE